MRDCDYAEAYHGLYEGVLRTMPLASVGRDVSAILNQYLYQLISANDLPHSRETQSESSVSLLGNGERW